MKKQITVNLVEGFMLKVHNNDTCMGQYYHEDNWDVTVIGESWEEVFHKFWTVD